LTLLSLEILIRERNSQIKEKDRKRNKRHEVVIAVQKVPRNGHLPFRSQDGWKHSPIPAEPIADSHH